MQKLQSELDSLRSSLGDVSHRCVKFFEEKPTSSSVPVLRSELNHAVEKMDKLHNLSAVYLEKLVRFLEVVWNFSVLFVSPDDTICCPFTSLG